MSAKIDIHAVFIDEYKKKQTLVKIILSGRTFVEVGGSVYKEAEKQLKKYLVLKLKK